MPSDLGSSKAFDELEALRAENAALKQQLSAQNQLPMSLEEFKRYGRQMIVEDTGGVAGQLKLRGSKVLVIGAGGLGCPCLPYLAGAGVGQIGIVDNDVVETSNLHRQVLHDSSKVGMLKCESAKEVLLKLNPHVTIDTYPVRLNYSNAFDIFQHYDIVLDCTDTPLTRYLISDVAVNLRMTVVSASGLGSEGQLSILNFKDVGPCYRCFYPVPPPPNAVSSCQEGGVIGPCIGLVGVMMAIETIKIILDIYTLDNFQPFLMQYSGFPVQTLRTFKMRGRQTSCKACGDNRTISRKAIEAGDVDYELFCGKRKYDVCSSKERISVKELETSYLSPGELNHILLDVRPHHHYNISHLPNTYNLTVKELRDMEGDITRLQSCIPTVHRQSEVLVICRHGNDSQLATRLLKDQFNITNVRDVRGGFFKYIDDMNPSLPKY
ncbi:LANO_0H22562g1_1 [Lachancea nothofagi CBS 11611]|uniref:Needs CLA4 to survive protein 3 n=1 Tax=Lachancea nothofagi CBS 11611 TaxID=1266666 RepID=A0A1G4KNM0_9SACH|nr:LANO_0H22562g1_1 [Lachancea nothofagi CBS 11611]